ncbi:MAG: phosphodiester glycosidase family protein [Rhizobiaceae bacterium]|nr:phosphodiester glycosidase family protein [Rhizobiaceae bacterium]
MRRHVLRLALGIGGLVPGAALRLPRGSAEPSGAPNASTDGVCTIRHFRGVDYILCRIALVEQHVGLALYDESDRPLGGFSRLAERIARRGGTLTLAMNAGMYHEDRRPVGLYVEDGREVAPVSRADGPGNFHMKPNGIFWIADGRAGVEETEAYVRHERVVDTATQSGPMLLVDGALHPRFIEGSTSLHIRNGVATAEDGAVALFVMSRTPVNFHDFASFFKDELGCRDALYLDGSISSLFVPDQGIREERDRLGPMFAVTAKRP